MSQTNYESCNQTMAAVTEYDRKRLKAFFDHVNKARKCLYDAMDIDQAAKGKDVRTQLTAIPLYVEAQSSAEAAQKALPKVIPSSQADKIDKDRRFLVTCISGARDRISDLRQLQRDSPSSFLASSSRLPGIVEPTTIQGGAKKKGIAAAFASQAEQDILGTIVDSTNVGLSDIVGNEDAKQALRETVILPALNPALFTGLRSPVRGILLFGPPGNGKTMMAKAVASEGSYTFFNISAATIMSKWVGEGEKMMRELFRIARERQPSIIFIDEIDSMLSARGEDENGSSRRVKTEFLLQFDGITTTSNDRIVVLAATNRPFDLDEAVLRRFPRRIFIDLPSAEARFNAFKASFSATKCSLSASELRRLADHTEGYSFSDLQAVCTEAAWAPLRELPPHRIQRASDRDVRAVNFNDVMKALSVVRPATSEETRQKLREYAGRSAQIPTR
uniref:microtubule-severing ATPase n=1 Tax=Panagrellus redivivus TaxID=6233 RepID=A0A7E4VCS6_PANRE